MSNGKLHFELDDLPRFYNPLDRCNSPIYVKLSEVSSLLKKMVDEYPKEWKESYKHWKKGSPCTEPKNRWFIQWLINPYPETRLPQITFYYCQKCGEDVNPNDQSSHKCKSS